MLECSHFQLTSDDNRMQQKFHDDNDLGDITLINKSINNGTNTARNHSSTSSLLWPGPEAAAHVQNASKLLT